MDYGFHAPTLSWPVTNTMMVEPTESESLDELKRFVKMEMIRREIFTDKDILKNAPHTARVVSSDEWVYNYTREQAAYPVKQSNKFWPAVSRIDNVYGDRNLVCAVQIILMKLVMDLKDWLNSINYTKKNLIDEDPSIEKDYPPYIVNRCMSGHLDAIMFANEMNMYNFLPKKMQYDFFINILRTKKRYSP